MHIPEDTISAPATAPGQAAIAVIRTSGPRSIAIADRIFRGPRPLGEMPSHSVAYGRIVAADGTTVDDVCATVFRGPRSYTGEDTVELSVHGSQLITAEVMALLLKAGARQAEPGEFTRRAYMNGKLDLVQAEAVADIVAARTAAALKGARGLREGALSEKVATLRQSLVGLAALLELELDFTEDDISLVEKQKAGELFSSALADIGGLLASYGFGRILREGVEVAIVGPANSGKSSLMNCLLSENRAIVSPVAGTTRDVVREEIDIGGLLFRLHDTAGIRQGRGRIEKQGIERSQHAARRADIVLFLSDARRGFAGRAYETVLRLAPEDRIITVLNKIDLGRPKTVKSRLCVSAKTGEGLDELVRLLHETALGRDSRHEDSAMLTNRRQFLALETARENLIKAQHSFEQGLSPEFTAVDLRAAIRCLEEVTGAVSTEETLNHIFANFCIGK